MAAVWKKLAYEDDVMLKTVADANSVIYAVTDNTPAALTMAASTIVARLAAGNVVAATVAEILTLLGISSTHNMFSTTHADTAAAANPVDGDLIIGNVTPKWSKLAISIPAAGLINHLAVANGELRPSWKALFDATAPTTIAPGDTATAGTAVVAARRDHLHTAPATYPPAAHALSAHSNAAAVVPFAGQQATDFVLHAVANAAGLAGLTGVVGKMAWQTDVLAVYLCVSI